MVIGKSNDEIIKEEPHYNIEDNSEDIKKSTNEQNGADYVSIYIENISFTTYLFV